MTRPSDIAAGAQRIRSSTTGLLVLAILLFGLGAFITFVVLNGGSFAFDAPILLALRTPGDLAIPVGPWWLKQSAIDFSALGGFTLMWVFGGGAVAFMLRARRFGEAGWFATALIGASLLNTALKTWVRRSRPEVVPHLEHVTNSSFPSGHAMISAAVYLTLAFMIGETWPRAQRSALTVSTLLIIAIGLSRVYLGVHWPSDVVAGSSFGVVWALSALLIKRNRAVRSRF